MCGVGGGGGEVEERCIRYVCGSLTEDIGETHFGGFLKKRKQSQTGEETKPKTRKQVMEEIVSKSKAMKVRTISAIIHPLVTPNSSSPSLHTHMHTCTHISMNDSMRNLKQRI